MYAEKWGQVTFLSADMLSISFLPQKVACPHFYLRRALVCFAYRSMLKMEVRLRTAFCAVPLLSRSSSLVQDTALSRLRHGFKSRTGRLWGQQILVLSL